MSSLYKPELLAPAGSWECVRSAVANGADAIYFGLPKLNARLRADNFTEADLPELTRYVHERGVKAYVTMNTLVFTGELSTAEEYLIQLHQAGVDAAIVQDVGLCHLARNVVPDFEIHASTQMTLTSPEGLLFARKLGITRAVLARELSLRELEKFKKEESLPLEVFVHGALCVAYSGQCLTSESLGQRSANRGECAQACRLPYQLVVDGELQDMGDKRYLLSPQDLAAVEEIPRLVELGIESFKIEGRLKTPEYVAAVCQVYRKAIDAALESREASTGQSPVTDDDRYKLEMTFSRGLFSGWFHGVNHQKLVHARYGKKRGPFVGFIKNIGPDYVETDPQTPLQPGDGLVFDTGGDTNKEQGGRLYSIKGSKLFFEKNKIRFNQLKAGDRIWKTDDPHLEKELRQSFAKDAALVTRPLNIEVHGAAGRALVLRATFESHSIELTSAMPLQLAEKRPLSLDSLKEQLGRLGGTPFHLQQLTCKLEGAVILPVSELNRLRRELVDSLMPLANQTKERHSTRALPRLLRAIQNTTEPHAQGVKPELSVLCRTLDQLEAALKCRITRVYADFEDIRRYRDAVSIVREADGDPSIFLATPRIQKAGEQGFFKLIESMQPDGVLIRNLGALTYFKDSPLHKIGDFSLNIANPLSAHILKQEGLERLTISYDLNVDQVLDLIRASDPAWFELTLHQHMPMFHMEHCVFAAFLSNGTDHTNCGRPCDRHQVKLRDRVGAEHPLKADVGCRNTVFHQKTQSGAAYYNTFLEAGLRHFRVELLNESKVESAVILEAYQDLLSDHMKGSDLIERLKAQSQLGVTNGTLTVLG